MNAYTFTRGQYDDIEFRYIIAENKEQALKTMAEWVYDYHPFYGIREVKVEGNIVTLTWGRGKIKEEYILFDEGPFEVGKVY
jgi:hypothetical protein